MTRAEAAARESALEIVRVKARVLLADESWFQSLPSYMKDEFSDPNHNAIQAAKGRELARMVLDAI